jgi:hypothetical protein
VNGIDRGRAWKACGLENYQGSIIVLHDCSHQVAHPQGRKFPHGGLNKKMP